MSNSQIAPISTYGIGRRKRSVASVYLIKNEDLTNKNSFQVNQSRGEEYFQYNKLVLKKISLPLQKLNLEAKYHIVAKVKGGGLTGQADAIKLGLARAICKLTCQNFETFRPILKKEGVLSRDSRIKERRKYGFKKARKGSQYSKR